MNTPIVYIAGPISNQPGLNKDAFYEMADTLRRKGFITRNPHEFCSDIESSDPSDPMYYRRGFEVLSRECTDIVFLKGWEYSTGARIEFDIAKQCKIAIHTSLEALVDYHNNEEEG